MAAAQSTKGKKSLKRKRISENVDPLDKGHFALPLTPWSLSKEEKKTADADEHSIGFLTKLGQSTGAITDRKCYALFFLHAVEIESAYDHGLVYIRPWHDIYF